MNATLVNKTKLSESTRPSRNEQAFRDEYKYFLQSFLFPLLGNDNVTLEEVCYTETRRHSVIEQQDDTICFYAGRKCYFQTAATLHLEKSTDNMAIAKNIVKSFLMHCSYAYGNNFKQQNRYTTSVAKEKAWKMDIQEGIVRWIFGGSSNDTTAKFFDILEKWAVKTYEGKHVTLGFVVNPSAQKQDMLSFLELQSFLEDDSSAVLSDCIHSIMEIDKNCNLINYLSVTKSVPEIAACELNNNVPLRFIHTVQQFVPRKSGGTGSDKVGIFLLSNGDILIVKNGATKFVKRNLRWLSMNNTSFIASLGFDNQGTDSNFENLLANVYASVLDVSFSHSGGLIAIVDPAMIPKLTNEKVLNPYNNLDLAAETALEKSTSLGFDEPKNEQLIRRKLLTKLLKDTTFTDTDRKLRSELIALDGACIVGTDGKIYACGAIIQNDSGSSTGGRSSAAKKLSRYGVAIKISTDGYIEVYKETLLVYAIK